VGRWNRVALWVATVVVVALAAFPYYGPLFTRAAAAGKTATVVPTAPASTRQVVLNIEGMDCIMCAAGLQNSLRQIPGVASAEVSYQDHRAVITYDPSTVEPSQFEALVVEAGLKVAPAGESQP
jgi:copper chaperone CopZ